MIENMSRQTKEAGKTFHQGWTLKMQSITRGDDKISNAFLELAEALHLDKYETDIQLLKDVGLLWQTTWTDLVQTLLRVTAEIPAELSAGSEAAQRWAHGKVW